MESSPLRVIPLLSTSSPCRGILFYGYREACEGTTRLRGCGLEDSWIVALGYDVLHVLELSNCNICVV